MKPELKIDPELEQLIPPLAPDECRALEESILREGIREPLVVWRRKGCRDVLVDGHNRYRIAKKHDLPFKVSALTFSTKQDVKLWMWQEQSARRNWSQFSKVEALIRILEPELREEAQRHQKRGKPLPPGDEKVRTDQRIAEMSGCSEATVQRVRYALRHGAALVLKRCRSGEYSIKQAYKTVRLNKHRQEEERRESRRITEADRDSIAGENRFTVFASPVAQALEQIPPARVSLILTDPPYGRKFLPLYEELALVAAKTLKKGGYLVCMTGQIMLPDVMNALGKHLDYFWTGAVLTSVDSAKVTVIRPLGVRSKWKPLLVYTNGKPAKTPKLFEDLVVGDGKAKELHLHGQNPLDFHPIISTFTKTNDLVWDPFCGAGSIPLACLALKRRIVASDADPVAVKTTLERLREASQ